MKVEDCFYFGKVGKPKGFKGEVNIIIDNDSPIEPESLDSVYVLIGRKLVSYPLSHYKLNPKGNALGKFEGLNSDDDINRIKNLSLYLPKEMLPELDSEEFYMHELVGCTLFDQQKGEIGEITEINNQTAQTIMFVEYQNEEIIIPFVDDFIVEINTDEKKVVFDLPEGIIDLNE